MVRQTIHDEIELEFSKARRVNATVYSTTGAVVLEDFIPMDYMNWDRYAWQLVERRDHFYVLRGLHELSFHDKAFIFVAIWPEKEIESGTTEAHGQLGQRSNVRTKLVLGESSHGDLPQTC